MIFFILPAKLRFILYGHYFYQLQMKIVPASLRRSRRKPEPQKHYKYWIHLPILPTSRQLHEECQCFVLERGTFDVTPQPYMIMDIKHLKACRRIAFLAEIVPAAYPWHYYFETMSFVRSATIKLIPMVGAMTLKLPLGIETSNWYEGTKKHALLIAKDMRKAWQNVLDADENGKITKARQLAKAATNARSEDVTPIQFILQADVYTEEAGKLFHPQLEKIVCVHDRSGGLLETNSFLADVDEDDPGRDVHAAASPRGKDVQQARHYVGVFRAH